MEASCCVCSLETAKYRCPQCRLRYCSLDCCRRHKEGCVPKDASRSIVANVPDTFPTRGNLPDENDESDEVPLQKLQLLGSSEELKGLLLNTHLRQLLLTLDQTENKDEAVKKYMQEPLFVEFADRCLSLVDAEEKENLFSK
ncbi:zinc finger HIT domain-containing protein 3 [Anomaloglossus baeobatrachus]|uniref:zinc finger HIT domain-containing protein 3 n=1 Tax=Anomaloglossus baeobatrachus TaxID=238106 RepID=UPI003F4F8594